MKGIDEETASGILDRISDEEQLQHAVDFAEKKIRSMQDSRDDRKLKHNVITSLVRRGYSWEIASKAFDEAFSRRE
jgi:regulatory protein